MTRRTAAQILGLLLVLVIVAGGFELGRLGDRHTAHLTTDVKAQHQQLLDVGATPSALPYPVPGIRGPAGSPGTPGSNGLNGAAGPRGEHGRTGKTGPQGIPGPSGSPGADGRDGATGPAGPVGPQGPQGDTGPKGDTGATGADGKDGTNGQNGNPPAEFSFTDLGIVYDCTPTSTSTAANPTYDCEPEPLIAPTPSP